MNGLIDSSNDGRLLILLLFALGILSIPFLFKEFSIVKNKDQPLRLALKSESLYLTGNITKTKILPVSFEAAYPLLFQKIPINSASKDLLETIPGIGHKTSISIIEKRNLSGPFNTVEDLEEINGLGLIKIHKISKYLSFE